MYFPVTRVYVWTLPLRQKHFISGQIPTGYRHNTSHNSSHYTPYQYAEGTLISVTQYKLRHSLTKSHNPSRKSGYTKPATSDLHNQQHTVRQPSSQYRQQTTTFTSSGHAQFSIHGNNQSRQYSLYMQSQNQPGRLNINSAAFTKRNTFIISNSCQILHVVWTAYVRVITNKPVNWTKCLSSQQTWLWYKYHRCDQSF